MGCRVAIRGEQRVPTFTDSKGQTSGDIRKLPGLADCADGARWESNPAFKPDIYQDGFFIKIGRGTKYVFSPAQANTNPDQREQAFPFLQKN